MTWLLLVLLIAAPVSSAEAEFAAGVALRDDAAAARPHFARAAQLFDQAWEQGDPSASLAINRSRSHFLSGDTPRAILALHAGLDVAPWHTGLQQELEQIRDAVAYPESLALRPRPSDDVRSRVSPRGVFFLFSLSCLLITVGCITRAAMRSWWAPLMLILGTAGIFGVAMLALALSMGQSEPLSRCVIRTNGVTLRCGNGTAFPLRVETPLPAGIEGRVLHQRGGWVLVECESDIVGWLPESAVIRP
ncbi:MAG: hypothetical protein LC104_10455 [Bacteroidales bacterium]|nr:hypothetical protein [Bacteroidales bacterium]